MTTRKRSKFILLALGLIAAGLMMFSPIIVNAAPQANPPIPTNQPAPEQQRFNWSYEFESGMNYRFDLGRPTTFHGVVPQNPMTANVRRDANVSLRPPGPRTGNTIMPTDPTNWAFANQRNQVQTNGFWSPIEHQNPNAMPGFDLQQHGINSQPQGNPMGAQTNVQTSGASQGGGGGFLPPTSIGD